MCFTLIAVLPSLQMIWMEASTNPLLRMVDIEAVAKLAKGKKPVRFQPLCTLITTPTLTAPTFDPTVHFSHQQIMGQIYFPPFQPVFWVEVKGLH